MIELLQQQALLRLAEGSDRYLRVYVSAEIHGCRVEVSARRFKSDKTIFGYALDGVRLARQDLQQLLCVDTDCPQCQATQRKWQAYRGVPTQAPRSRKQGIQFRHLMDEVQIEARGLRCIARPAAFVCLRSCPAKIHAAAMVRKVGWDLFDSHQYLAGGVITNPATKELEPLLPTIAAAQAWLDDCAPTHAQAA